MSKKPKVITIVGPTATGKTGVGVRLAKELNGEIVSADSRQVYRGLDIGTGKDLKEYNGIKYHLIDIVDPGERFTLFDYLPLARKAIEDILSRKKTPIIVGGTGLYVQALTEGFQLKQLNNVIPTPFDKLRAGLVEESNNKKISRQARDDKLSREQLDKLTLEQLRSALQKIDSDLLGTIDINNPHRIIRAIEKAQEGLTPVKKKPEWDILQIAIDLPREKLYQKIDCRVDERFKEGMVNEVVGLLKRGVDSEWLIGLGLEYRVITSYVLHIAKLLNCSIIGLPNNLTMKQFNNEFELMKQQLKWKIHQFARRQMTWFHRFPEIVWERDCDRIEKIAKEFLGK